MRRRSAWGFLAALASALLIGLASALILRRAADGQISVGDFSIFVLGIAQVQGTVSNLLNGVSGIYQNLLYMRNLFDFLELPSRDLDAGEVWRGPIDTIEFQDVGFRYPLTERDVLRGVNFSVRRGQALALVGENGAGKTTLVKLLTRLFEPSSGTILLNGMDAARFSPRSVQKQMSIIFQDFGQYQMSARENVALAEVARLSEEGGVEGAVQRAGAEFVDELPEGLNTPLGRLFQGGRQLSGGQWQRLALARLYFRDASVLVFDEPTAALDARAESDTIEALRSQTDGPHHAADLAPLFHRSAGRSDRGAGRRRDRGVGQPRGTDRAWRAIRRPLRPAGAGVRRPGADGRGTGQRSGLRLSRWASSMRHSPASVAAFPVTQASASLFGNEIALWSSREETKRSMPVRVPSSRTLGVSSNR